MQGDRSDAYHTFHTKLNGIERYGWVTLHLKLNEGDIHQTCRSKVPSNKDPIFPAVASLPQPKANPSFRDR